MKKFNICVETGPTGNDYYELVVEANSLESAIKKAYALHKETGIGTAMISERACHEIVELTDEPVKAPKMKKGEMLAKALVIATNAHAGQFDKGGNPYILHPLKVMHYLKSDDEELMCVALLHDVFEDCSGKSIFIGAVEKVISYTMLREEGMSERVISGIKGMTKVPGQTYEEYKQGVFDNDDSMRAKSADLRHNSDIRRLKGVTDKDVARIAKYMKFYSEIQTKLAGK